MISIIIVPSSHGIDMLLTSQSPRPAPPSVSGYSAAARPGKFIFPTDLQIRHRGERDTSGLYEMLRQEDFQYHCSTLDPFTSIDDLNEFLTGLGSNKLEIVASIDAEIVGFAGLYWLAGRQAHVGSFTLSVHEGFQRRGIGAVLMKAVIESGFRLMGLQRLQATVFIDNTRALSLYRRFGFVIEGTLNRFARRGDGFIDAHLVALTSLCCCTA